ncbi:tail fiber domain-containing protein [Parabacteroides goldsteinii]|uniref:tail fiber domain-containing protein n=1 Tax=Parabacteroides goldsteinii TaxID=328812 RepID=UPI001E127EA0|nr:tail fiber domain-containing protein [Parabacteroides goldsteinii]MBS6574801.1 tail fiber domain-containing protein [Parabacteroides goldsteinii]
MKKKVYLLIVLANLLCLTTNAQLRLLQNGRVQVGTLRLDNEDLQNVTTMQVFGPHGDMRSGSKLTFGDFGQYPNFGWNVFIGEYGTDDTDQLWLHGKKGIYLTATGQATSVIGYYNPAVNSNFVFNTNLRVNGVNITSDARLKENVQSLQNPLNILEQVSGVTYNYKLSEISKYREQDDSKFSEANKSQNSLDSQAPTDAASIEKANKDKLFQSEINRVESEEANRKRIGFLAQDVQKVLPELVQTDDKGVMSIDYIGFIPLIVESIKEMQLTIQNQNEQIENLQRLLSGDPESKLRSSSTSNSTNMIEGAKLYNREGASVSYSLPFAFTTANIQVYDITGRMIKDFNLDKTNNALNISPSEIGYGTFVYALFVDGRKADILKKIVTQ